MGLEGKHVVERSGSATGVRSEGFHGLHQKGFGAVDDRAWARSSDFDVADELTCAEWLARLRYDSRLRVAGAVAGVIAWCRHRCDV